jgi:hypothetical protein
MGIRIVVGDREPMSLALRRFRKLLERSQRRPAGYFVRYTEIRRAKEYRKWLKARRETAQARREGRQ